MTKSVNKLFVGDNLDVMRGLNSGSVDLIYLDPPFNSKRIYSAPIGIGKADAKGKRKKVEAKFNDIWTWDEDVDVRLLAYADDHAELFTYIQSIGKIHGAAMKAYLTFMAQRIIEMHRVLKDSGSLYLHCDPTASHYLKLLLDYVFGKNNMRNEIVWNYGKWSNAARYFQRNHDIIFYYAKTKDYVFNPLMVPRQNETPYHTNTVDGGQGQLLVYDRAQTDKSVIKRYTQMGYNIVYVENEGVLENDTWSSYRHKELAHLNSQSKERTGYPTQKPLSLLTRIVKASSNAGDMVMDPFCGCATTCVAAQNLGRNWIGIDISDVAVNLVTDRLSYTDDVKNLFTDFDAISTLPARTDLKILDWDNKKARQHFFKTQKGKCNGCGVQFPDPRHFHVDHIYPKSKGGAMVLENLQLLCGSCNSIKGDRPMEYLNAVLKRRKAKIQMY